MKSALVSLVERQTSGAADAVTQHKLTHLHVWRVCVRAFSCAHYAHQLPVRGECTALTHCARGSIFSFRALGSLLARMRQALYLSLSLQPLSPPLRVYSDAADSPLLLT